MHMALKDSRGMPLSTSNPDLVATLERATTLTASYFLDPLAEVDRALAQDPDFAMAHCLRAGLAVMSSEKGATPMLADSLAALERCRGAINDRERAHAAAARAWLAGDFARSIELYGRVLHQYPRDLIALQVAHIGDFLLGQSQTLRDRVAQVLPQWSEEVPGYSYVLGMYAFGLEETNLYERAEETGRRALDLDRRDAWAVHAVTHVLEMQGRTAEGITWLTSRSSDWAPGNGFAFHNWWHLALFHLELGENQRALEIYDRSIRPQATQVAFENVDASALLWRLGLRGVDVGNRWQALVEGWAPLAGDGFYAFNDVHALMAFIGAGRADLVERVVGTMTATARAGQGDNATTTREVGLPLARALVAFSRGAYQDCLEELLAVRQRVQRFGGSHAQRDVVHLTLVEAALRAGQTALARALSNERIALKPDSPFNRLLAARARAGESQAEQGDQVGDQAEGGSRRIASSRTR
jgi:tetratricopeptide (TPR) repeat protein